MNLDQTNTQETMEDGDATTVAVTAITIPKGKPRPPKQRAIPAEVFEFGKTKRTYPERKQQLFISNHAIQKAFSDSWDRFKKSCYSLISNLEHTANEDAKKLAIEYLDSLLGGTIQDVMSQVDDLRRESAASGELEFPSADSIIVSVGSNQHKRFVLLTENCDKLVTAAVNAEIDGVITWTERERSIAYAKKAITGIAGRVQSISQKVSTARTREDQNISELVKQAIAELKERGPFSTPADKKSEEPTLAK